MSTLHAVVTTAVCTLTVAWLPLFHASFWDRWGAEPKDDEQTPTIDELDAHFHDIHHMLTGPSAETDSSFREVRSLAAQYVAAYVTEDPARMATISTAVPPQALVDGLTYVAHTYASIVAFHEDGDVARVVERDCNSAIERLTAAPE